MRRNALRPDSFGLLATWRCEIPVENKLELRLAHWGQKILAIAKTGLAFTKDPYDVERYEELLKLAAEMTASVHAHFHADETLAEQLESEWRRQVREGFRGYITPNISVGAFVFDEEDRILLVRSAFNGEWCFPVGNADVGYTAAEVARKEVWEETGLMVTPLELVGIADSFRQGFNHSVHIYNIQFYCRLDGGKLRPQTAEIEEVGFFGRDELPTPLVIGGNPWVERAFGWHFGKYRQPFFD